VLEYVLGIERKRGREGKKTDRRGKGKYLPK